jgi:DNA-binding CsgD family transcriptional regulator
MANCEIGLGSLESAARFADEAVRSGAPLAAGAELAEAYRTATWVAWLQWDRARVHEAGNQAIRLGRESGAWGALVQAMALVGETMAQEGQADDGLVRIREAIAIAVEHGIVPEAEFAMFFLGFVLRDLGAPRIERRAAFEERLRYCRERGYRNDATLWSEIELAFVDGEWDRVSRLAADLRETIYATAPALIAAFVGAASEGPGHFQERAMDIRRRMLGSSRGWTSAASSTAALSWLAGDARATLDQATAFADVVSTLEGQHYARLWAVHGHLGPVAIYALLAAERLKDPAAVERWTALMCREASAREPHSLGAARLFARARRADREGKLESALSLLAEVEPLLVEAELPFALAVTRLERADLLLRRGASADRAAATEEFAAVVPYWERANARWYLAELRHWAARRKLPFPVSPPRVPDRAAPLGPRATSVLSRREREVAELVAQGMTNAEIADRLTISVRTAEGHVEHIRNKLGFHSRVQIGTWVAGTLVPSSGGGRPS